MKRFVCVRLCRRQKSIIQWIHSEIPQTLITISCVMHDLVSVGIVYTCQRQTETPTQVLYISLSVIIPGTIMTTLYNFYRHGNHHGRLSVKIVLWCYDANFCTLYYDILVHKSSVFHKWCKKNGIVSVNFVIWHLQAHLGKENAGKRFPDDSLFCIMWYYFMASQEILGYYHLQ